MLTNVEHFILNSSNPNSQYLRDVYDASGVPTLVIFNKFGNIAKVGHPGHIVIESVLLINY